MRWPFGPPHLTLKPSKKQIKTTKNNKKQQKITMLKGKTRETKKKFKNELFSYQSIFGGCPKFLFWQLGPKNAHPQNTIKMGGFSKLFLIKTYGSRNGIFGPKQPNPEIPVIFFLAFFLLFKQQKFKKLLKAQFYSVLANIKEIF